MHLVGTNGRESIAGFEGEIITGYRIDLRIAFDTQYFGARSLLDLRRLRDGLMVGTRQKETQRSCLWNRQLDE